MKGRIAFEIETRNEQRGCSFCCIHLERGEGTRIWSYHCLLFGELEKTVGADYPQRDPGCVASQIPFDERKGRRPRRPVKSKAPTAWERINGKDKL